MGVGVDAIVTLRVPSLSLSRSLAVVIVVAIEYKLFHHREDLKNPTHGGSGLSVSLHSIEVTVDARRTDTIGRVAQ